jgi:hypothetical protein
MLMKLFRGMVAVEVDPVADLEVDPVADLEVDLVADLEVDLVADLEVDLVAGVVAVDLVVTTGLVGEVVVGVVRASR